MRRKQGNHEDVVYIIDLYKNQNMKKERKTAQFSSGTIASLTVFDHVGSGIVFSFFISHSCT